MKIIVFSLLIVTSLACYAIESVTATVDTAIRPNDTFFALSSAYYKSDAVSASGIVDSGSFKVDVVTSYTKKTTASSGSNLFRVRVQLLSAADAVIPLAAGKTQLISSEFDMTVNTFTPSKTKNFSFTVTPAAALTSSVSYKIRISIQRDELVNASRVWVNDVASMTKDITLSSSTITVPSLTLQSIETNSLVLAYKPSAAQALIPWKLQSSTTLTSGSFSDVSGVTFVLDEDTDVYEASLPVDTTAQPKRFFRLVAP